MKLCWNLHQHLKGQLQVLTRKEPQFAGLIAFAYKTKLENTAERIRNLNRASILASLQLPANLATQNAVQNHGENPNIGTLT